MQKRRGVFLSSDLKEDSEDECLTEREESSRAQVRHTERILLSIQEHGISEYPRLSEESEKEYSDNKDIGSLV